MALGHRHPLGPASEHRSSFGGLSSQRTRSTITLPSNECRPLLSNRGGRLLLGFFGGRGELQSLPIPKTAN